MTMSTFWGSGSQGSTFDTISCLFTCFRDGIHIGYENRYTMIHQSRGGSHTGGSVVITDAPVCICDQGRGGCGRVRTRSLSFDYDDTCCLFLLQLDCVRVWCLG